MILRNRVFLAIISMIFSASSAVLAIEQTKKEELVVDEWSPASRQAMAKTVGNFIEKLKSNDHVCLNPKTFSLGRGIKPNKDGSVAVKCSDGDHIFNDFQFVGIWVSNEWSLEDGKGKFMWAWNDEQSGLPSYIKTGISGQLREYGIEHQIAGFDKPEAVFRKSQVWGIVALASKLKNDFAGFEPLTPYSAMVYTVGSERN